MRRYESNVASRINGLPVFRAQVRVYTQNADGSQSSAALVYGTRDGMPLAQPIYTDALGRYFFYVANGTYSIVIGEPGQNPYTLPDVQIFDETEQRGVAVPSGEPPVTLPRIADRAGKYLASDYAGNLIAVGDPSAGQAISITDGYPLALTGLIDAGPAIRAAIVKLPADVGGSIYIGRGSSARIDTPVLIDRPVTIIQDGTPMVVSFATGDVFTATGINHIYATNLNMSSNVTRTSGAFFKLVNCHYTHFGGYMENAWLGLDIDGGFGHRIRDLVVRNFTRSGIAPDGGIARIGFTTSTVDFQCSGVLSDQDATYGPGGFTAANMPSYGIKLCWADAPIINDNDIIHFGSCLLLQPKTGQVVAAAFVRDNFFDTATRGIDMNPEAGGLVLRGYFDHNWTCSHLDKGMWIRGAGTVLGLEIVTPIVLFNAGDGARFETGADIKVRTPRLGGNGGSGLSYAAGVPVFVEGGYCGDHDGSGGNAVGIFMPDTTTGYHIEGVDLTGNGSPIAAQGDGLIRNCLGVATHHSGLASIPSGSSSVVVNHGLRYAPKVQDISGLTPISAWGTKSLWIDPTTITSSQFTVRVNSGAADVTMDFRHEAATRTGA